MRATDHAGPLFMAVLLLLCFTPCVLAGPGGSAASPRQVIEYPISVKVECVGEGQQSSIVYVWIAWWSCHNPRPVTLNEFMDKFVPDSLRRNRALPEPAHIDTMVKEGVVDIAEKLGKPVQVLNQGKLPVWLSVEANLNQSASLAEDKGEKFAGDVSDLWSVKSKFVTRFTACTEIAKLHEEREYTYTKTVTATGKRAVFSWIDP
jgi:hypothetical protein